ncbi:phage major capsid protein, P2 family [Moritella viscosa]|uniref:Major capsid protein n=3 Tax=Moritella viscosa TaxID=80854 RepID=A0A1L0C4F0_9GAMM|nr:phage major capsid protein, P2 family [Moritella viscosa]SGZ15305.1 Major capsid protein [Moritella viscosa]SGZ16159.1 Major capsid protein [Moritella viscosa]SHO28099.1 Major capsid protein [Moritella viscosa]
MKPELQIKLNAFKESVQQIYGVEDASERFNVTPAAGQILIDDVKDTDDFLTRINVITVDNLTGEAIGLGVGRMIASRTDTASGKERQTRSAHDLTAMRYECIQTNFDTHITYTQLNAFFHLKDFEGRVNDQIRIQSDLDKIRVGFYGTSAEKDTDINANPNGEDVNEGWIEALRKNKPENVLSEVVVNSNEIRIGEGGDFVNLDLAVLTVKSLLDPVFASTNDLIAIVGNELIAGDQARLYAQNGNTPSEKVKIEMRQVISTYGGLPTFTVSNFPPRGIMVTSFDNLSIYILNNSIRKSVGVRNDKRDQVENFECMSMAYVVEQLGKAAALEFDNVKLKKQGSDIWA